METDGAGHDCNAETGAKRLQKPVLRKEHAREQDDGCDQFRAPNNVLAEKPGLREQSLSAEARRPNVQIAKDYLRFRRVGKFEPQRVKKDGRNVNRDAMGRPGQNPGPIKRPRLRRNRLVIHRRWRHVHGFHFQFTTLCAASPILSARVRSILTGLAIPAGASTAPRKGGS